MATESYSQRRQPIIVKKAPTSDSHSSVSSSKSSYSSNIDTYSSYSRSTAPTSHSSPHTLRRKDNFDSMPAVTYTNTPSPSSSSSSVDTYDSLASAEEGQEIFDDDDDDYDDNNNFEEEEDEEEDFPPSSGDNIPPVLPTYRPPISDPSVRPSDPQFFGRLFPSLDRLSIRHDDLTPDGNMNLRIDTVIPSASRHRGPITVQLFHLRMHDLTRREFSLRRYCRDSGREVCNSRRAYIDPTQPQQRPGFARSVSSAMHSFKVPFQRASNASSIFKRPGTSGGHSISSRSSNASLRDDASMRSTHSRHHLVPTESIKLEFTNYARVDVKRKNLKGYDFEWWGHKYTWQRVTDKNLGLVSFHLIRDGQGEAVAHIVPETRSPNQVMNDEIAGGWVPPCHMWISDPTVVNAKTDVADVIIATGLIALVDDCIKERWQIKKPRRLSITETEPRKLMGSLFQRRNSHSHSSQQHYAQPMRRSNLSAAVAAY